MKLIKINKEPEKIFFTGDLHYQHKNILTLDDRNYETLEDMESYIRAELVQTLSDDNILIDLGDMFFGTRDNKFHGLMSCIPCPIYKILGNHDKEKYFREHSDYFEMIEDSVIIEVGNQRITLSHYPILDFPYMYSGGLEIFGHTHGHLDNFLKTIPYLMVDIGFSSGFSKERGTFLHSLDSIYNYFDEKTSGKNYSAWANEKYHGPDSLWNP